MKDIFDDFLLDGSSEDLDSLHASEQKFKFGGGLKKLANKVKQKVKERKARRNPKAAYSDKDVAKVVSTANSNPKGSKSTVTKPTVKKKSPTPAKKRVDTSKTDPKINVTAKKLTVKKTNAPIKTKRNTGKTYKMAWDGMSAAKKAKYKGGYSDFETEAKKYNSDKDAAKKGGSEKPSPKASTTPTKVKAKHVVNPDRVAYEKELKASNKAKVIKGFNSSTEERMTKERTEKRLNRYSSEFSRDARKYGEEKAADMLESQRESTGVRSNDGPTAEWFHSKKPSTKQMDKQYNKQFTGTISDADRKKNAEIAKTNVKKEAERTTKAKKTLAERKAKKAYKDKTTMRPKGYGPSY